MNRNTVTGFVLIAIVLIVFSWWSTPSKEQIEAQKKEQEKIELAKANEAKKQREEEAARLQMIEAAAQGDSSSLFYLSLNGEEQMVTLENDKVKLLFSTKGGTLSEAVVKGFNDRQGNKDVTLFTKGGQQMKFVIPGKQGTEDINTEDLYFQVTDQAKDRLTLTAMAADSGALELTYRLDGYMLRMSMEAKGLSKYIASKTPMQIEWTDSCRQQERGHYFENRYASVTYKEVGGGTDYLNETAEKDENIEEALDWVAFKTQFFSTIFISRNNFHKNAHLVSIPQPKGSGYVKYYKAELETDFANQQADFEMVITPNDFRLLKSIEQQSEFGKDLELSNLVYLGWWLVRWINRWFTIYVFDWLTNIGLPMGIVLILITLLLKALTFPMVKKSYMSSAKMRVLKPKIEEATKQYDKPEDQMLKQQAQMQIYSQYGVSPLGGCLPMLIQMPIWIAMFFFVPNAIQLRGESFLWIDDLSTYDPIIEWGTHIWGIGDHLSLTCILFCVSNIAYSYLTMRQQRDQMIGQQAQQMKMMQWMMYLMPVMFFFMFNDYSSGLNFYYFISLFFSALIMWTLRKTTNDEKLLAILEANYKENKANPKKPSGFAARMAEMQKQAEAMRNERLKMKN
ncbi:MAG: membrane protein insertase YidC [Prevotella sp.]|nr:membrane protein insertase YidC [Prevotella sp.]